MSSDNFKDDILDGALAFAEFTGMPRHRVFYLLERGLIPGGKMGRKWIGSKRAVRAWLDRASQGTSNAA